MYKVWYKEYAKLYDELSSREREQIKHYKSQQEFVDDLTLGFILDTPKITFKKALDFINTKGD